MAALSLQPGSFLPGNVDFFQLFGVFNDVRPIFSNTCFELQLSNEYLSTLASNLRRTWPELGAPLQGLIRQVLKPLNWPVQ
jgi:hypothetical protein